MDDKRHVGSRREVIQYADSSTRQRMVWNPTLTRGDYIDKLVAHFRLGSDGQPTGKIFQDFVFAMHKFRERSQKVSEEYEALMNP
ncbi:MAG: hypothetical protein ACRYGR_03625, partial [Janthinobacterium lividum]